MAGYTILDPKQHKDLRIITERGAEYGENLHIVPVLADELKVLVAEYAIFFIKDNQTGQFGLNVLTGFEPGENLYLQKNLWQAHYVPLNLVRQPFMVGIKGEEGDKPSPQNTLVTINLDSPRVNKEKGEALFDTKGKSTDFLNSINGLLVKFVQGMPRTQEFINTLLALELLMPITLKFTLADGEKKSFSGLYNIDEEKLAVLSGNELQSLHQKGYLQACHMIIASFGQIQKLIDWKNNG
ncbi:SapC family protein [Paraglaciecola sp. L3A3]|uniref:SapC family protein n=1 Tax=Paraglaciecola sp. L3A3 TaxID=2686358 RepID=UPI00131C7FCD|nr:SapC family protein [Paraglaciecola sp. L3A3]